MILVTCFILVLVITDVTAYNPTVGVHPACTHFYNKTDNNGGPIMETPNFPDPYEDDRKCGWTIESPEEAADISVKFHYFDIEISKRCTKYDYVKLYKQGNGQQTWDQIGYLEGYCGKQEPFTIREATKRIFIEFVADGSRAFNGFNATFNITITQAAPRIRCMSNLTCCLARKRNQACSTLVTTEERDVITLQCDASGIPPPTYKFEKKVNDTVWENLRPDLVKNFFYNGSIQLKELNLQDKGIYKCTATNKISSSEQTFELDVKKKCLCPKNIMVSYFNLPPYTRYAETKKGVTINKGVFYVIVNEMVQAVCGTCEKGHGASVIQWREADNEKKDRKLSNVKTEIEERLYDIYLPIKGLKGDNRYRNVYYFLPIVDSPGVAFVVIGSEDGASAMAIFSSIVAGWPILVLTIVMAVLAGIIMWMLDTYWNEEQFPRNFSEGIVEGFWWAFVTMTTVGYGDIAPVGVPGRLFAVVWILTGLVIIAIFTGVIATSLTVNALSTDVKLYGTTVGALNDSSEWRMGVVKNAKMKNYTTYADLQTKMAERVIEGSLLDAYVAAHHNTLFKDFRVNNIFKSHKSYGIVFGERLSNQYLYDKFQTYLETNKAKITSDVEKNVQTLEEPTDSAAEEASADLFNPSSPIFVKSMMASSVILLILTIGGLMFEYGYLRPRHRMIEAAKNLEMVESTEVKEMASRAKMLKKVLLHEVQEFYDRWAERLGYLTKKHKEEQKKLLTRGTGDGPLPSKWVGQKFPKNIEDGVEMIDGTDGLDKTPSTSDWNSPRGSSNTSLVNEEKQTSKL